jgi:hypothetical protein
MKTYRTSPLLRTALALLAPVLATATLRAEILWDADASSHTGNGGTFVSLSGPGIPPGYGQTVGMGDVAYGGGNNQSGVFTFGFINNPAPAPTFADTELSATSLVAGTTLTLYFNKGATDKINYLAIVGDPNASVTYELISDTRIKVVADVVNPVPSASGDNAAAFGLVIDYQNVAALDFKQAVFVTNMHHYDVGPPVTRPSGAAGINANGTNGSAATFRAFLPTGFLVSIGITDPSQCKGYVDGLETPPGDFTNEGLDDTLGFDFGDAGNPDNTVLKVVVVNDEWSPHDIQFGEIRTDPNAALRAEITKRIAVAKKKLRKAKTPAVKKKWKKKIRSLKARLAALSQAG